MNTGRVKRRRLVPVMEIQRMTPEQIVAMWEKLKSGEVILVSIYSSFEASIGLKTKGLKKFVRRYLSRRVGSVSRSMRRFSRRWYEEDVKDRVSEEAK